MDIDRGDIDPRLRASNFHPLPPPSYALNPIRLPPPQQQSAGLASWTADSGTPYFNVRPEDQHQNNAALHPPSRTEASSHALSEGAAAETKRPRACEACRGLKVRCEPDPANGPCKRCAKAGRSCVVTAPSRKRQKKTDNRVAELERKIDALTASLEATKNGQNTSDGGEGDDSDDDANPSPGWSQVPADSTIYDRSRSYETPKRPLLKEKPVDGQYEAAQLSAQPGASRKRRASEYLGQNEQQTLTTNTITPISNNQTATAPLRMLDTAPLQRTSMNETLLSGSSGRSFAKFPHNEYADVVDRKVLDASVAAELFRHYTTDMAPQMPVVTFESEATPGLIRKSKPILFLAILSVASGRDYPDIQRTLTKEIMRVFADHIILNGEKTLEIIQALQIMALWYWPEEGKDSKHYLLTHMAAIMAFDLGMDRRSSELRERNPGIWKDPLRTRQNSAVNDSIEGKRAWLGCYIMCANCALALRRPTIIHWSPYMDECLQSLRTSPQATNSDRLLGQWAKLQRLADEFACQTTPDHTSNMDIGNLDLQASPEDVESRLRAWEKQRPQEIDSVPLTLHFHVVAFSMKEVASRLDQILEVGKPIQTRMSSTGRQKWQTSTLTQVHVSALKTSLASIYGIFDAFLSLSTRQVQTLPIFYFIRITYTSLLLIKVFFAAASLRPDLGNVCECEDDRVDRYLQRIIGSLRAAALNDKSRPASNFLMVLFMLRTWFERQREGKTASSEPALPETHVGAQPVDSEKPNNRPDYQKIQLQGGAVHRQQPSMQHLPELHPMAGQGMATTGLHLLSAVAMGNSAPNGYQSLNGSDPWYNYAAEGMRNAPPTCSSEYYPNHLGHGATAPNGVQQVMYPGFEQAMGMTFGDGMMNDGGLFYDMMQAPNMFEDME